MTIDIAKLIEMREAAHRHDNPFGHGAAAMDFQDALQEAVLPPPRGGLLERHAMLEDQLAKATTLVRSLLDLADEMIGYVPQHFIDKWDLGGERSMAEGRAQAIFGEGFRASEALPPCKGDGETP